MTSASNPSGASSTLCGRPKVLCVVRWPVGGIRTWLRYVYRDPAMKAFDITIVAPDLTETDALKEDFEDTDTKILLAGQSLASFLRIIRREIGTGSYDLLHTHGFTSMLIGSLAVSRTPVAHIFTQHDVVLDDQYRGIKGAVIRKVLDWSMQRVTFVHSVGETARLNLLAQFDGLSRRPEHVVTIRNGIDFHRFLVTNRRNIRAEFNLSDDHLLIGFFGRFMSQKGFRYLIDAVDLLVNGNERLTWKPMVIAVGGGGFRDRERRDIRVRGLEDSFLFVDFSPDIAALIKGMDVVVMPSLWEACSILAMEVLTSGTPLLVSEIDSLAEVTSGSPAGTFAVRSGRSIANALIKLRAQEGQLELATRFASVAAKQFDVSETALKMREFYFDCLGRGLSP